MTRDMSCSTMSTVIPRDRIPRIRSPRRSVSWMFRPQAGSSSSSSRGSPTRARAISTTRCRPKGRLRRVGAGQIGDAEVLEHLHRPAPRVALVAPGCRAGAASPRGTPTGPACTGRPSRSRARSCRGRAGSTGTCAMTPSEAIRWEGSPVTSRPAKATRPETGGKLPATRLKSVDLPAPLGPMMALIAPARQEKLTPSITCRPPNQWCRPSTASSAAPSGRRHGALPPCVARAAAGGTPRGTGRRARRA